MSLAEARAALKRTVQAGIEPILSDGEIDEILAEHLRYSDYAAETAYVVGNRVRLSNGRIYRCIVAGTSATAALAPQWPDAPSSVIGSTISDGTGNLLWEDDGPDSIGDYDLGAAAHDAWMLKAAKVAANVDYSADGQSVKASQEAAEYRRRANLTTGAWVF